MFINLTDMISGEVEGPAERPLMEAQAEELNLRFNLARQSVKLVPGDFCVLKHGLGQIRPECRDTILFVFWRWLDDQDWQDRQWIKQSIEQCAMPGIVGFDYFDCVMARVADDAGALIQMLATASHFKAWDGP